MKDYIPKSQPLPPTVYKRVLALIRDYPRLCSIRDGIFYDSPAGEKTKGPARPTERRAIRLAAINDDLKAVEKALDKIPEEYRRGVMDNIIFYRRLCDLTGASERTWQKYRALMMLYVAQNKRWI